MGLFKDFYKWELRGIRTRYWLPTLLGPQNWTRNIKYRHQRAERGWSERDTWGAGEYIAGVAEGMLHALQSKQNPTDWDEYFKLNYENIEHYGYKSLTEVADDIELYLWWQEKQWEDEYDYLNFDDRLAIELQLYSQLQNAMHFVAENIGHLWW